MNTTPTNAAITKEALDQFFDGYKQADPSFAAHAARFDGWQELARQELESKYRSFISLLAPEQLAEVAAGRVDVAAIAKSHI